MTHAVPPTHTHALTWMNNLSVHTSGHASIYFLKVEILLTLCQSVSVSLLSVFSLACSWCPTWTQWFFSLNDDFHGGPVYWGDAQSPLSPHTSLSPYASQRGHPLPAEDSPTVPLPEQKPNFRPCPEVFPLRSCREHELSLGAAESWSHFMEAVANLRGLLSMALSLPHLKAQDLTPVSSACGSFPGCWGSSLPLFISPIISSPTQTLINTHPICVSRLQWKLAFQLWI